MIPRRRIPSATPGVKPPVSQPVVARRNLYRMKSLRNKDNSMWVWFVVLSALVAVVRYGVFSNVGRDLETQLALECANANTKLPRMIDDVTRMERMEMLPGKRVHFTYTLIGIKDDEVIGVRDIVSASAREHFSADPDFQRLKKKGARLLFTYMSASGKTLIEFEL